MDIYLNITGILIALLSLYLAINTLNFSKKSFLLKETYDPILYILKTIRDIKLSNTILYDVSMLEKLRASYLFEAFEIKEKKLITYIIDKTNKINEHKINGSKYAERALVNTINEHINREDTEDFIIQIEPNSFNYKELYSLVSSKSLYDVVSGDYKLNCKVGHKANIYHEEIGFIEKDQIMYKSSLEDYVEKYFTLDFPHDEVGRYISRYEFFINSIENDVYKLYKELSNYRDLETEHLQLNNAIELLISLIIEKIKRMLIPYYLLKKNALNVFKQIKKYAILIINKLRRRNISRIGE